MRVSPWRFRTDMPTTRLALQCSAQNFLASTGSNLRGTLLAKHSFVVSNFTKKARLCGTPAWTNRGDAAQQVVGRERIHVVFHSRDLDAFVVDRRRVNSDVRLPS